MFLLTFSHTMARSLSCALLVAVNKKWLAYYTGSLVILYNLYKLCRRDFRYGTNLSRGVSEVFSVIIRFAEIVMVDFTAFMQARHPAQVGGLYWTASMVMAQIGCFACGWMYLTYFEEEEETDEKEGLEGIKEGRKIADATVWFTLLVFSGLFVTGLTAFLLMMQPGFAGTFFSTDTFSVFLENYFTGVADNDDASKSGIFGKHPVYREHFEGEIKAWALGNWERWEREQPAWFTDAWIDKVPDDCVPLEFCVRYKKTKGRVVDKRRGSVSLREMMGGGAEAK
jgi:hypothetical protein